MLRDRPCGMNFGSEKCVGSGARIAFLTGGIRASVRYGPAPSRSRHLLLGARAGFVTEAFRAGADAHAIMRQTGQQSPGMLEVYTRENAPLMGSAVTRIGL